MNKRILALAVLAGFALSCSGDDNGGGSVSEAKLMKKWYNESYKVLGQTIPYDDHETCGKDYVEFMDGGTARFVDVWMCDEIGDPVSDGETFQYTLSGNTLTIAYAADDIETVKIKSLTDTKLVIETSYDFNEDGKAEKIQETYTSTP